MPHTTRVRAKLARYLLGRDLPDLRRRLSVLRVTPYPPGSRALASDEEWATVAILFPDRFGFVYGSGDSALVYSYDAERNLLLVEFAAVDGALVGV